MPNAALSLHLDALAFCHALLREMSRPMPARRLRRVERLAVWVARMLDVSPATNGGAAR